MRQLFLSILIFLFVVGIKAQDRAFIGSTPANAVVKSFLGMPITDSVDFIRWKIILRDNKYQLNCNYGISKPNTNGFINGGQKIQLSGTIKKDNHYVTLVNGGRTLTMVELNEDLLHLTDNKKSLLVGNGGWSYTLCSTSPKLTNHVNLMPAATVIKDSMAYQGRTPCGVPGIIPAGKLCYKLKWYIVFYPNAEPNGPGRYKLLGTPYRKEGGRTGSWIVLKEKDGRIIYQLNDEGGKPVIYLLKLDEGVMVFIDSARKLLVGDEDFSYTLNKEK